MQKVNGINFDLDYCRQFSDEKLRKMYNSESSKTLDLLISTIRPVEPTMAVEPTKKTKKENS
jgi:hypothetical protein